MISTYYDCLISHLQAQCLCGTLTFHQTLYKTGRNWLTNSMNNFYRPGMQVSVSSLAWMAQSSDESPMRFLTRFKSTGIGVSTLSRSGIC